ncbi:MAG: trypsin-like peptidase domain-containing protein [Maricaulaceae bacterium]
MFSTSRTFTLGIVTALMVGCATPSSTDTVSSGQFAPTDRARNVLSFADTLETVLPSIVRIGKVSKNSDGELGLSGIGSGAVIDAEKGYVVTNAHVVEGGVGYLINLPDGRVVKARLVGIDTPTDIAVLQAEDMRVDALSVANSDNLRVGDVVFAVGYPLGLEQSMSLGVISGLGRSASSSHLQDFIQTDAAINSGNSGGPLLDSRGRLIGVNTAIVSKSGGSNGIGFSVPASLAVHVIDQLITHGTVKRGSMGIEMDRVSEEASERAGINHWDGALITGVRPESSAEFAGLQAGDIITHFGDKRIKTPHSLRAIIGVSTPGKPYSLTYIRDKGVENTIDIEITPFKAPAVESLEQLGAFLRPVTSKDNVSSNIKGVYVRRVAEGSPADKAGLQVGDIVGAINNELVTSKHVCDRLIHESKGRARLLVYRYGVPIPVIINSET